MTLWPFLLPAVLVAGRPSRHGGGVVTDYFVTDDERGCGLWRRLPNGEPPQHVATRGWDGLPPVVWDAAAAVLAPDDTLVERLCGVMHDAYEAAAVEQGWETQQRSRKPWTDVPEENKATMRVALRAALAAVREEAGR